MKNYIRPNMEISKFDVADIITASGEIVDAASLLGEDKTLYEAYATQAGDAAFKSAAVFEW